VVSKGDITVVSELVLLPACELHALLKFPEDKTYITYRSRRQRRAESLFHSESDEEEKMGDRNEHVMSCSQE
jgi:hypothetical protein